MIVITNILIRNFVLYVLGKTGAKSESQLTYYISLSVFLFTFTNTAVIILLSNANLKSQGLDILTHGKYADFNTSWYLITGDILLQTMIINSFTPMIIILVNLVKFKLHECWDRSGSSKEKEGRYRTRKTSA